MRKIGLICIPNKSSMRGRRISITCEECQVKGISKFGTLCNESLEAINYNKSCTAYKKGQILFHEDTRPLGVFCVNKGKLKVYKTGDDGKDQIIQISRPGDLLGYRAMIGEDLYPVTAEALEDVQVCFVPKTEFVRLLDSSKEFSNLLLKEACHELSKMTEMLTNLAQKTVRERLAVSLLMLNDVYKENKNEEDFAEINLTREDLANIVGTATETIIRLLHDFKEEKLIKTNGRKIMVLEPDNLVKVGNIY
ncbi:MAG: CRP-like cAMP-binding protein [Salibacteraceae bacterium]